MTVFRSVNYAPKCWFTIKDLLLQVFEKIGNRCKKGCRKLTCWPLLQTRGRLGSIYSAFWVVPVRCPKNMFFRSANNLPKIEKVGPRVAERRGRTPKAGDFLPARSLASVRQSMKGTRLVERGKEGKKASRKVGK